jgi:hypothetical protein
MVLNRRKRVGMKQCKARTTTILRVPVHDVGSTAQFPCYVVSKCTDGTDLAMKLKRSRLSIQETVGRVAA